MSTAVLDPRAARPAAPCDEPRRAARRGQRPSDGARRGPRVLVVQRIVPPYRVPLFRALAASSEVAYEFAYGEQRAGSALESVVAPDGLAVRPVRNTYFASRGRELAVWQRGVSRLVRSGTYDAVIAEFNPRIASNVQAFAAARLRGVPFVWWGHGAGPNAGRATVRARVALARVADAVIFYNEAQAERFVAAGLAPERAFVAPNSLDVSAITAFARPPERAGDRAGRDRVLTVGRLIPEKRVDLLVRAFALARGRFGGPQRLTIVGDGPERPALEQLAASLCLTDSVEFAGSLYDPAALAPHFNAAWAMVSPGGIGLAAVQSLAFGVPVVLAAGEPHGPEASALADGQNAVFFPGGQVEAMADALVALDADPARWLTMARAARATSDARFGLDRMTAAFDRAVRHVCPA
ncbi:hypothetical protein tb265_42220 [Gemmatimonadetes bacterium T265]|nr:hypothetical protein tb265_42220 [Gemmatimonadetes bacterium T265]